MKKIVFSNEEKNEIKQAIKNNKNVKKAKLLQVLELKIKGKSAQEIAEITGYNEWYIWKIIKKYKTKGINSITENNYKGNNRKLTVDEESDFLAPYKERAEKGEFVTVKEIRIAYDERTGSKSSVPTIYLLLHRHNWRKVMPRSKNPKKASEEEIIAYKKNQ